jgi:hypothetical protein
MGLKDKAIKYAISHNFQGEFEGKLGLKSKNSEVSDCFLFPVFS